MMQERKKPEQHNAAQAFEYSVFVPKMNQMLPEMLPLKCCQFCCQFNKT
tara:strand:+ start:22307 stop:22453 length:147 start_codon:yes stop_codon:yes gene_type:complete